MENLLPEEITLDILSRLPAVSVPPSSQVCKTWRRLIHGTEFADAHLRRLLQQQHQQFQQQFYHEDLDQDDNLYHKASSSNNNNNNGGRGGGGGGGGGATKVSFIFLAGKSNVKPGYNSIYYGDYYYNEGLCYKTVKSLKENRIKHLNTRAIVGSCNGLICFCSENIGLIGNDPVYIINPITWEEVNLPKFINNCSNSKHGPFLSQSFVMVSGFGYLPSTNEYKVVRISYRNTQPSGNVGRVQVYTLGSGSGWRKKGTISAYLLRPGSKFPSPGVFVDGALHWLDFKNFRIVAFDLADEEFFVYPSPTCFQSQHNAIFYYLTVLGGCLCVVHQNRRISLDIWSLKKKKKNSSDGTKEQDCEWSCKREFSIAWEPEYTHNYEPFALMNSGELLFCSAQSQKSNSRRAGSQPSEQGKQFLSSGLVL
ncbi:F-box domain [Macleaya cordata]|uniref:F-box domain n=1 Tax=Macleaya cordata TaxID=56857 RepID=A0A200R969_MACCD|nr:F-box domain [Macleaya cordata]